MRKLFFVVLICLFPLMASAENGAGLETYFKTAPVKVGWGKFYYKGLIHAYDAGLYSPDGKYDPSKTFALELTYKTDIEGADIADKSLEEMNKIQANEKAKGDAWLTEMKKVFPNVDDGTSLTAVNKPGKGVDFLKNGVKIGQINDAEFAGKFFAIWLSPKTSEKSLRAKLLGEKK